MQIVYRIIQWIWGFPQTLCGYIKYKKLINCPHESYKGSIVSRWNRSGGVSLGMFIFIENNDSRKNTLIRHEYGHTIQSLILGPLYLLVVGFPSYVWCNSSYYRNKRLKNNIEYDSLFCEKWASYLGNKYKL